MKQAGSLIANGLAWAEAVTILPQRQVPQADFDLARSQFSEKELSDLTLLVIAANGWNRINIAFHVAPIPFTIESREPVRAD